MSDRASGLLLGLAIGDALGMPVEGLSHQNVRTYYKGIKAFRADEKRGELDAGQWTADTQNALALAGALAEHPHDLTRAQAAFRQRRAVELRRPTDRPYATSAAAAAAAPLGLWWRQTDAPLAEALAWTRGLLMDVDARADALVAAFAQADAARRALGTDPATLDGTAFLAAAADAARAAEKELEASGASGRVSQRLDLLAGRLFEFPLDLQDLCGDTGPAADEAFPFGLAMAGQRPGSGRGVAPRRDQRRRRRQHGRRDLRLAPRCAKRRRRLPRRVARRRRGLWRDRRGGDGSCRDRIASGDAAEEAGFRSAPNLQPWPPVGFVNVRSLAAMTPPLHSLSWVRPHPCGCGRAAPRLRAAHSRHRR